MTRRLDSPGRRILKSVSITLAIVGLVVMGIGAPATPAAQTRAVLASPIVRTVPLGIFPNSVAVDESTNRVFVANYKNGTVSVLDATMGTPIRTVALPPLGSGMTTAWLGVDARTAHVFVSHNNADRTGYVSMLDARTGALLRTLRTSTPATSLAVSEDTARVFVMHYQSGTITVLDSRSGTLVATPHAQGQPDFLVVAPRARRIFVNSYDSDPTVNSTVLTVLNARTGAVVGTATGYYAIIVDDRTGHALASTATGLLRLLDARSGAVLAKQQLHIQLDYSSMYNDNVDTRLGRVYVAGPPVGADFAESPHGSRITGAILAVDIRTGTVLRQVAVTPHPVKLSVNTTRGHLLTLTAGPLNTTNHPGDPLGPGQLQVRDEQTLALLRTVQVGVAPVRIILAPTLGRAYVVNAAIGFSPRNTDYTPTVQGHTLTHGTLTVLDLNRL